MARYSKTAQEFIQNSFSPIIAVLCSPKVDTVMTKNNLSFTELLQPFTTMEGKGQFREPGGTVCIVKNWRLIIREVNWKPLQPMEARRELNNAVLDNYSDKVITLEIDGRKFDIPQSTPWFDAWRETYLEVQFPSDHEFTKHFLACIIVGTTFDDNIVDTFNGLNQQYAQLQNVLPPKLPKWFNSGVLKTYLLLHDVSSVPKEKADASFDQLKQAFGASNCLMLCINSKVPTDHNVSTDLWNQFVKRTTDNSTDITSSMTFSVNEPQPHVQNIPTNIPIAGVEDGNTPTQVAHPLTADSEVYDNANSLQASAFTGSIESVNTAGKAVENEVYGSALNSDDVDAIRNFLKDYVAKSLLPYVEKQIEQLSEVVANKKGVSRSLLSATKRWFSSSGKPGNTTGNNTVIYSSDCPELQLRRLGDLWFMLGQWQRAFDTYHTAKREFYADSAWLCYAGALEMAAISAFMAGEANRKTHAYMEESIVTYLNTCRMVQYAVRATLLSVLCLSSAGQHGEAAKQLIRMTSEDSDLRSAMLLEQAALCFLAGPDSKAMCRKYAFHMVLAGHRFTKAGQKKHAYRCYQQAHQVYGSSGWRLATDHAAFALGRLGGALGLAGEARQWLCAPLAPHSTQPAAQHHAFLKEYMLAHQQWVEKWCENGLVLPELPLPLLKQPALAVLCVGPAPLSSPRRTPASSLNIQNAGVKSPYDHYWTKLEEMLVQVAQGSVPMIFRPTVDLYTEGTDTNPNVPKGEPVQIAVTLWNPLKISLVLRDVELLWQFIPSEMEDDDSIVLNNEPLVAAGKVQESNVIVGQKLSSVIMEAECKKVLTFTLTPMKMGQLHLKGVAYKLINAGETGNENGLVISGKLDLCSDSVNDKLLQINVTPPAPCLQMTFSETNSDVISGELRTVDVEFRNVGPVDMKHIYIAVSHPDCVSLVSEETGDFRTLYDEKYRPPLAFSDERAGRVFAWRAAAVRHVWRASGALGSGACARVTLQLRPRACLLLLAYCEPAMPPAPSARSYRLLRQEFTFNVTEAVEISVTPRRSLSKRNTDVLENMSLVVEAKNICNGKESNVVVDILEASLLSRQWKLTDLIRDTNKEHTLESREKSHLILKARRIENPPDEIVEWSSMKITQTHPEGKDNINVAPYSSFVTDNKTTYLDSSDQFSQNNKDTRGGLIQSMFVVRWKVHDRTKGRSAVGQHCLWLDCFTKTQTKEGKSDEKSLTIPLEELEVKTDVVAKNNNKDNVVLFKLEHTQYVKHDFNKTKLCLIPVTLNVVNCYGVPVNVFIDMSKKQMGEAHCSLGWTGALGGGPDGHGGAAGVHVSLQRFEARRVRVQAVCAAPGTYTVGSGFSLMAAVNDVTHTQSLTNNTSLLVVTQAAPTVA